MKLSLGTAQFGLDYGVTNKAGKVNTEEVAAILEAAKENNIAHIDTAIAYGDSENILGCFDLSSFRVTSKIPSLTGAKKSISQMAYESLERLNVSELHGLMLHDENDLFIDEFRYLQDLNELKTEGIVKFLGASFYSADKAIEVMKQGLVDIIQVPANLLDNRFEKAGIFDLAKENKIEVHVRSLFLQGLLAVDGKNRPHAFQNHNDLIRYDRCAKLHKLSSLELALSYLTKNRSLDLGVVGCVSAKQLEQIIKAYHHASMISSSICDLSSDDDVLLNPSKW